MDKVIRTVTVSGSGTHTSIRRDVMEDAIRAAMTPDLNLPKPILDTKSKTDTSSYFMHQFATILDVCGLVLLAIGLCSSALLAISLNPALVLETGYAFIAGTCFVLSSRLTRLYTKIQHG
jgi:hypothetical protein